MAPRRLNLRALNPKRPKTSFDSTVRQGLSPYTLKRCDLVPVDKRLVVRKPLCGNLNHKLGRQLGKGGAAHVGSGSLDGELSELLAAVKAFALTSVTA